MIRTSRNLALAVVISAAAPFFPAAAQQSVPTEPAQPLEYAVKFVCGNSTSPNAVSPLVPLGTYFTAINVHNPGPRQDISQKVTLAAPAAAGLTPPSQGLMTDIQTNVRLAYDGAIDFDCQWIFRRLHAAGITPPRLATGFLVLQSRSELDVVAVYTAAQAPGRAVVAMHTERVPVRRVR